MSDEDISNRESLNFELLHLLENEAGLSQRDIADRLSVSIGRVNYCLKALISKGAIKVSNFRSSPHKMRYAYQLTPKGISEKAALTGRFIKRKLAEYNRLKAQLDELQRESAAATDCRTNAQDI